MSSKNRNFRPGFAPRPTKEALHKAAKEQRKLDETKAQPHMETLATVDAGEVTAADVEVLKHAVAGDQQAAADALVANLTSDTAAGNEQGPEPQPAPSAPAAESPPTSEEQAKAVNALITDGKVTSTVKPPKGTEPTGLYALGKRYSPKTDRNSETWGKICKALADGPKTMKELTEVVKGHGDFLGYMTRGGHIVPHKVEQQQVSG